MNVDTAQIAALQRPTWTRGRAQIDGDYIVLEGKRAVEYGLSDSLEQRGRLLMDLAGLCRLGITKDGRIADTNHALDFARRHGLLWHRPKNGGASYREALKSWLCEGHDLTVSIVLYMDLREAITTQSTERLRARLRTWRDNAIFWGAMPEEDEELLEGISVRLAERINKGLEGCSPTIVAACSLVREGGKKEGPPGDFRSSINPSNLVAVAYKELVAQIESKARFKECVGCGMLFRLDPSIHHRDRTFCTDACYERTRKRRQRAKKRKPA
jgi:hypothetical protein